jgi:arsenate reductase
MKITFACVENSCRSQIAEALAKNRFARKGVEFSSAGTHPAEKVDDGALTLLHDLGIEWRGKPKSFADIDKPDIVVTLGCEVRCPFIPGARMISWDIPDPKGKSKKEYKKTKNLIENKLINLMKNEMRDHK